MDDRFQNQPWYIKLWRYRYFATIPFYAIHLWWWNSPEFDFKCCWGIATGMAHGRMKWYYTWEEVKENLGWDDEDCKPND